MAFRRHPKLGESCPIDDLDLIERAWAPHRDAASAEGWNLFAAGCTEERMTAIVSGRPYGERPLELQAIDDAEPGLTEDEAWRHVWRNRGRDPARTALALLEDFSPNEYAAIRRFNSTTPARATR